MKVMTPWMEPVGKRADLECGAEWLHPATKGRMQERARAAAGLNLKRRCLSSQAGTVSRAAMTASAKALVPELPLWQNMTLAHLGRFSRWGLFPRTRAEHCAAAAAVRRLSIKTPGVHAAVGELSGGNAQKVSVARWLCGPMRLLLLDEPTAGIDIGAKRDIQRLIRALASQGAAVVLVDSEFDELMLVSDRILVVARGTVVAERRVLETTEQELVALASGLSSPRDPVQERVPS